MTASIQNVITQAARATIVDHQTATIVGLIKKAALEADILMAAASKWEPLTLVGKAKREVIAQDARRACCTLTHANKDIERLLREVRRIDATYI